jgi:uncharacterized protein YjbI with pentapeptide repeats
LEADLRDCRLWKSNLTRAWLEKANLARAWVREAELKQAILKSADLTDAKLGAANLADADLTGACLEGADFRDDPDIPGSREANLAGVKLHDVNLQSAYVSTTQVLLATVDRSVRLPAQVAADPRIAARLATAAPID